MTVSTVAGAERRMARARRSVLVWAVAAFFLSLPGTGCAGSRWARPPATEPLPGSAPVPFSPAPAAPSAPEMEADYYVVQPGETMWRIARNHGVALDELARANGIPDPRRIVTGARLLIPRTDSVAPHAAPMAARASDPFDWPVVGGSILAGFGVPRRMHRHAGIDIGGREGQSVLASGGGRVVYAGATRGGYGRTVIIEHGRELSSLYAHNSVVLVHEGQQVERGQEIARLGRTGNASADHCHFELRVRNVPVDPLPYLQAAVEQRR